MPGKDSYHAAARASAVLYFAVLYAAGLEAVARAARVRTYEPGHVVFLDRDPCAGLHVVEVK